MHSMIPPYIACITAINIFKTHSDRHNFPLAVNIFHNTNFEHNQSESNSSNPNNSSFRSNLRRRCSNSRLMRVISGSSLKGTPDEQIPSAPPSSNLHSQVEHTSEDTVQVSTKTLYPIIN